MLGGCAAGSWELAVTQSHRSCWQSCSQSVSSQPVLAPGVPLPLVKEGLCLSFVRTPGGSCLPCAPACPSSSRWQCDPLVYWPFPPGLCHQQSAKGTLCASSRSSTKSLDDFGSRINPWEVSVLQPDFVPLTTTCWAWPFGQFSTHLPPLLAAPSFASSSEGVRRARVESLAKAKTDNILCTPSVRDCFILGGGQAGEAAFFPS